MTDEECKAIEQECVEKVRNALKVITSAEIYDHKGYLNEKGYKALEELEGLDLFWVCDPRIKLVKESENNENNTQPKPIEFIAKNVDSRGYSDCFVCSGCGSFIYPSTLEKELDYEYCPYCGVKAVDCIIKV